MQDSPIQQHSEAADKRLVAAWIIGHVVLFAATIGFISKTGRTHPELAIGIGLAVVLLCTVESFLLRTALQRGAARRIVSRWDKEYALVLACCLTIMVVILDFLIAMTWKLNRPATAPLSGTGSFVATTITYLLSIPSLIGCLLLVRRIKTVHEMREDQCINCGYDLQAGSTRCPECGLQR